MAALREELDALKTANADLEGRQKTLEQQAAALDAARGEVERLRTESAKLMEDRFAALTSKALESNRTALLATAEDKLGAVGAPVREQLDKLNQEIRKLGESRAAAEASLAQQLIGMHQETGRLRDQAQALVDALKKPQVRGSWGEMTLRRTAELAGMVERCDFKEQVTMQGDEGVLRPDMVVHLADGKATVVDAKVSLKAFMEASEATDDATRSARLKEHAQQVRRHIDNLASKDYHKLLDVSPEFVVMFIPGEAFLGPALDADNGLLEYALDKGVVITTPTTFIALLRTVALAWTQASLAENLREVHDLGRDLYDRIVTFSSHLGKVGTELGSAVLAYNKAVGSMEARLLVSARRFQHLQVAAKPLPTPAAASMPFAPSSSSAASRNSSWGTRRPRSRDEICSSLYPSCWPNWRCVSPARSRSILTMRPSARNRSTAPSPASSSFGSAMAVPPTPVSRHHTNRTPGPATLRARAGTLCTGLLPWPG